MQVQARLAELQQKMMVGGEPPGGSTEERDKLKEELQLKKMRAERKRLERLRRITASDDTQFFEELFSKQTDKIEENRHKFERAKELLQEAR